MRRIIMCTGKGGVGKTTVSVATALHLARRERVLLLSTDPSGSLAGIFDTEFQETAREIEPNLDVVELTRPVILKLWRERFGAEIYAVVSSLFPVEEDILDYIEGAPALDEEFLLYYLLESWNSGRYDRIVWDTAPTASTLSLLRVQQLFYSHLGEAQKLYLVVKGTLTRLMRKSGGEPLALIEKWRKMTEDILALLARETSAWIVTTPERLPVEQALSIADALASYGIDIKGYILNRLLPANVSRGDAFFARKRAHQEEWLRYLSVRAGGPVKIIEERETDVIARDVLLAVAETLYQQ